MYKDKSSWTPVHIILFNDLFLVTKQKDAGYEFKFKVDLQEARVIMLADSAEQSNMFEFTLDKKTFAFSCPTKQEFDSWFNEIKTLKKELQRIKIGESQGKRLNASAIVMQPGALERQQFKKEEDERRKKEEEERRRKEENDRAQQEAERLRLEQEKKKKEEEKKQTPPPVEQQIQDLDTFLEDLLDNFTTK